MASSKYWDDRALRRLTDAEKKAEFSSQRIKKIYNQANRNIQRDLESVYANYSKVSGLDVQKLKELLSKKETDKVWKNLKKKGLDKYVMNNYKARISRLEKIQAQIYAKAKLICTKEELEQTACYNGIINDSYYKAVYDTQMGTGYDFAFSRLDNNVIDGLLSERWSGKNYSERIWGNTDILADQVSEIVGGALLSGQSIAKTSKQIRDRFNVAKHYSDRLVRTETNFFNNEADALAYEEMGLDKYVFVAILDNRTSPICQKMDNKVFELSERTVGENYPPLHPNCRSKTRGYINEKYERELKRRAINPVTGKAETIDNISYKEWLNKNVTKYGKKQIDSSYKMVKNKVSDKKQYDRYINKLGKENIGTFDNFIKLKYNSDSQWEDYKYTYRLKTHYDKAINTGELSALVDFDLYKHFDKTISTELHGVNTANDIVIKDHSLHFIDRVFGTIEQGRNGVSIEDIKKTLISSIDFSELRKDNTFKIYGLNNSVSINKETGKLVQVNPSKRRKENVKNK